MGSNLCRSFNPTLCLLTSGNLQKLSDYYYQTESKVRKYTKFYTAVKYTLIMKNTK